MKQNGGSRTVRAPRGVSISCKGWLQEAASRVANQALLYRGQLQGCI